VIVRSGFEEMKASPWEKEDPPSTRTSPSSTIASRRSSLIRDGRLTGGALRGWSRPSSTRRAAASWSPRANPTSTTNATTCWWPWARRTPSPGWNATSAMAFDEMGHAQGRSHHHAVDDPIRSFGGDAAFGPKNIIWAVAHGHDAAISIDKFCRGRGRERASAAGLLPGQPEEWASTSGATTTTSPTTAAIACRCADKAVALKNVKMEVELGFDRGDPATVRAERCLNCDVQTVFADNLCIECDACVDICPVDCITFTVESEEADLRTRLKAPALNLDQPLYVSGSLPTGRVMVKGRGRLPALRPVRRALPDRGPGTCSASPWK